jgi:hypothetical protein
LSLFCFSDMRLLVALVAAAVACAVGAASEVAEVAARDLLLRDRAAALGGAGDLVGASGVQLGEAGDLLVEDRALGGRLGRPLGMQNGAIPDGALTASTAHGCVGVASNRTACTYRMTC